MSAAVLTDAMLEELARDAQRHGVLRLCAVSLEHPGFAEAARALDGFLAAGREGEMQFIRRTAAVRKDPSRMLEGARTVLMGVVPYRAEPGPIARYAQATDYHFVLHRRLDRVAAALQERIPSARSLVCVDTKPLMERAAAALAGLGFIGKHGCVIVPGLGSYVLLGAIVTTAALAAPDDREVRSKVLWDACGACRRCLDACPTDAFVAPGELDPRRCISYLTIEHRGDIDDTLADAMGQRIAGCDVCQEVCPYNATGQRRDPELDHAWLDAPPPGALGAPLEQLAEIRSGRYRAFVRETALRRIPRRSMRRNALLALGNREGPVEDPERSAIEATLDDEDPQVRAAARRAHARRLG